jgi:hypothetical protein
MDRSDASLAESSSSSSPHTSSQWVDELARQVFGESGKMKDAVKILLERLGIDSPSILAQVAPSSELAKVVSDEVDKLPCTNFMKTLIKEKLPSLYKAAADRNIAMVTPAHMQEQAAKSRKAWSELVVKLSVWAAANAQSSEVAARYTREVLCAREPHLGVDGTTLYFQCPECPVRLAVKGAHSVYNVEGHLGKHPDKFKAPDPSKKRRRSDSSQSREGARASVTQLTQFTQMSRQ